ncbi:MAG: ABC transporter permease [Gammaproteobacteria bacterium]|nr:ABC transporter permease [Gammaproteobacteria bacterium]
MRRNILQTLFSFRYFILGSVKRELQIQCHGSLFGIVWVLLNPLSLTLVYALIFNNLMGAKLINHPEKFAYSIYLCAGLLPWNYFTSVLTRNINMFVDNANLLKKSVFPILTLPIIILLTETVNFLMALGVFSLFLIAINHFPGWVLLAIIPLLIMQQMLALGIGIFLGCFHVFFRDIGKSISIILQFWFWLTPIVYVSTILPEVAQKFLATFNPMVSLIQAYQQIILEGKLPPLAGISSELVLGIIAIMLALTTYHKLSSDIVDEL